MQGGGSTANYQLQAFACIPLWHHCKAGKLRQSRQAHCYAHLPCRRQQRRTAQFRTAPGTDQSQGSTPETPACTNKGMEQFRYWGKGPVWVAAADSLCRLPVAVGSAGLGLEVQGGRPSSHCQQATCAQRCRVAGQEMRWADLLRTLSASGKLITIATMRTGLTTSGCA